MNPSIQSCDTLITIASEQIWPQIIVIDQLKPKNLIILHSGDQKRSVSPANRLQAFVQRENWCDAAMQPFDELHTESIQTVIGSLTAQERTHIHLTGGTKLMSISLLTTAIDRDLPAWYFDGKQLFILAPETGFQPRAVAVGDPFTRIDAIDPLSLILIQEEADLIADAGFLFRASRKLEETGLQSLASYSHDKLHELLITNDGEHPPACQNKGQALELRTATILLKLGVPLLRSGIKTKPQPDASSDQEIDIVFFLNGRLHLVECKNRKGEQKLVHVIENALAQKYGGKRNIPPQLFTALKRIDNAANSTKSDAIFSDLYHAQRLGGITGRVIRITASASDHEKQIAAANGVTLIESKNLVNDLAQLLAESP